MNRLILIGNGFDLAHGLKTSYADFIDWYWEQRVYGFCKEYTNTSKDVLCTLINNGSSWNSFAFGLPKFINKPKAKDVIKEIFKNQLSYNVAISPFFKNIISSVETKGWVDIENEYYQLLIKYSIENPSKKNLDLLNSQLQHLQNLLIEYLTEIEQPKTEKNNFIENIIYSAIDPQDISVAGLNHLQEHIEFWSKQPISTIEEKTAVYKLQNHPLKEAEHFKEYLKNKKLTVNDYPHAYLLPDNIMFLNFNYTSTLHCYLKATNIFYENHIHGDIEDPHSIIFGHGDELDENFSKLKNIDNYECLRNIKTFRYLESSHYKKALSFIESAPFQVFIIGHSCGSSDRTLLNTIFEHRNCISIKPYYYIKTDNTDNYTELIQNISRNFTDMKLMRDRVVNKTFCRPITE